MKFIATLGVILLGNLLTGRAASIDWVGYQNGVMTTYPDSGSFFHGDNWLNYLVPTTNDIANFGLSHTNGNGNVNHNPHYIHFGNFNVYSFPMPNPVFVPGGNAVISNLNINSDSWTFDFSSGQHSGAPIAPPTNGSLTAWFANLRNYSSCASPSLTIRNGTLNLKSPTSMRISAGPGCAPAELIINGTNASLIALGLIEANSSSRLIVTNGGTLNALAVYGNGMLLNIFAGGAVVSTYGGLGEADTLSYGEVTVSGNNSLWKSTNDILLGTSGEGNLRVENGGRVETLSMFIGYGGSGNLSILSQGRVNCSYGSLAYFTGSVAQVTVAGNGAIWAATNGLRISGYYPFLMGGTAVLSVSNGGLVTAGFLNIGPQGIVKVINGGRLGVGFFDPLLVPSSTMLIGTGGSVYGNGTFVGNVVVTNGGIIQPGSSMISTLTFSNALTLAGQAEMQINRTNISPSDLIRAAEISAGGTLTVMNTGPALLAGDSFQLFATTNFTGNFTNVQLPTLSSGLGWDISSLSSNGTIKVCRTQVQPIFLPPQLNNRTNLLMKIHTLTGVKYVLQSTTNLSVPVTWKRSATNNGTGDVVTFPYSINSIPETFFRIAVE